MIQQIREQKTCQIRIVGLDLIRSFAILFVIAGHFFVLNTPFRSTTFGGFSMFIQALFNPLFQTGVPLFLLLTGYLNTNKTVSKQYYKGGAKTDFDIDFVCDDSFARFV
ncbi:acyltransferase family protein [Barnesiella sp. An55]|uniref:acyltransferase family protein n=1 Tax=Barnesiella sp. An55 TaxID=1965646 RepID=UPI001F154065|nr:acyltransferase family protein [Barnesiella sp. An55]